MNKAEWVSAVDTALGADVTAAESTQLVQTIIDTIAREVAAGGTVTITGFGVRKSQQRAARKGRNPYTGEAIRITATSVPKFQPADSSKMLSPGAVKYRVVDG